MLVGVEIWVHSCCGWIPAAGASGGAASTCGWRRRGLEVVIFSCSLAFVFFLCIFEALQYDVMHLRVWGAYEVRDSFFALLSDLSALLVSLSEEKFEWAYLTIWGAYEVMNSSFEWFEWSLSLFEWKKIWVDILESLRCIWDEELFFEWFECSFSLFEWRRIWVDTHLLRWI
jgi:hypothetical protein